MHPFRFAPLIVYGKRSFTCPMRRGYSTFLDALQFTSGTSTGLVPYTSSRSTLLVVIVVSF